MSLSATEGAYAARAVQAESTMSGTSALDGLTARLSSVSLLRFDGRNFPVWKVRMRAYLQSLDLWDAVERPPGDGSSSSSKKAADEEETKRKKAYSTLVLALNDTHLQMVMQVPEGDAHGVWAELVGHFERTTMASKAHTRGMLHKTRMQSGESFDLYRARVMELVARLVSMGETVSEGEQIYVLLEGLPDTYTNVKQTLEMNDALKMHDLVKNLRDFEEKATYKRHGQQEEQAHYAGQSRPFHGPRTTNSRIGSGRSCNCCGSSAGGEPNNAPPDRCALCKKNGHWADSCPYKKGGADDCHRCGRGDHRMRDCPDRRDRERSHQANLATSTHGQAKENFETEWSC